MLKTFHCMMKGFMNHKTDLSNEIQEINISNNIHLQYGYVDTVFSIRTA